MRDPKHHANHAKELVGRINQSVLLGAIQELSSRNGDDTQRPGAVLAVAIIFRDVDYVQFHSIHIGQPDLRFGKYARNAAEKIERLCQRRLHGKNEVASSTSADNVKTYGGCIVFEHVDQCRDKCEIYISLSGADPKVDEVSAYVIGEKMELDAPLGYDNSLLPSARELLRDVV